MEEIVFPKISIITCVYNGEKYIKRLLDSVLKIDYPNIEHIIVDDGSTDSSPNIIFDYSQKYKECSGNKYIKYIKQKNIGLGGATNNALKYITGDYWTWINCDDWYEPNVFKKAIIHFEKKENEVVLLNRYLAKSHDNIIFDKIIEIKKKDYSHYNNTIKLRKMMYAYKMPQLHFLVKTSAFDRINPKREIDPYRYNQDTQLSSTIFGNLKTCFESEPVVNYYIRDDSFLKEALKDGSDGFFTSRINSLDKLDIDKEIIESQKCVFMLNKIRDSLLSKFKNNHRLEYRQMFKGSYLKEASKVLKNDKKYLLKDVQIIYHLSTCSFLWFIIRYILISK